MGVMKVGSKVRVVNDDEGCIGRFKKGDVLEVKYENTHFLGFYGETGAGWSKERFKLVEDEPQPVKPPIGLRPAKFAILDRQKEILDAMGRYHAADTEVPLEWMTELQATYHQLKNAS